jgi:type II secretory pathway pseudopilin PulG
MKRSDRPPRRGAILSAVLAVLVVVLIVGLALTKSVVLDYRSQRIAENQQQAFWFAESALQRGIHELARSPDYVGETWVVSADMLSGDHSGTAKISVEPVAESSEGKRVRVEAVYADDTVFRIVYQRELVVNPSSPGGSS